MAEKKQSVYSKIADDILDKIKKDIYPIGSMLEPERVLMEKYGVERTTVRRGLELLRAKGYIKKTAGLGSIIVSKEPVSAEEESSIKEVSKVSVEKTSSLLAIIPSSCSDADNSLIAPIKASLEGICRSNGTKFSVLCSSDENEIAKHCSAGEVTCCIIFFDAPQAVLEKLDEMNVSVCFAFAKVEGYRCIIPDIQESCELAAEFLTSLGHSSIAFIGSDEDSYYQREFRIRFTDAVLLNSPESEIRQYTNTGGSDEKSGFERLSELIRRAGGKFSAAVAVNSLVAKGALKAAKYYRTDIPEELSVMVLTAFEKDGCDCVYTDPDAFAAEIYNGCILCRKSEKTVTVCIEPSLSHGETTAEAKAEKSSGRRLSDFLL